jgi:Flp pilus assembly protein TadG
MSIRRNEEGQVTAFVVVIVVALLAMAGLVIDGGSALAAKRRAINEADSAARAGSQALAISSYRATGRLRPDADAATSAARAYLARTGDSGDVVIRDDQVVVTVRTEQRMTVLGIVGIRTMTLTGVGQAHLTRGVEAAEP